MCSRLRDHHPQTEQPDLVQSAIFEGEDGHVEPSSVWIEYLMHRATFQQRISVVTCVASNQYLEYPSQTQVRSAEGRGVVGSHPHAHSRDREESCEARESLHRGRMLARILRTQTWSWEVGTKTGGECVAIYTIGMVGRLARNYMSQQPKEMVPPQQKGEFVAGPRHPTTVATE